MPVWTAGPRPFQAVRFLVLGGRDARREGAIECNLCNLPRPPHLGSDLPFRDERHAFPALASDRHAPIEIGT